MSRIYLCFFLFLSSLSFAGMEKYAPYLDLNKSKNKIFLEGVISLVTLEKLEKVMAREYALYAKDPNNHKFFRERAKKFNIKKINYLINTHKAISPIDKERTKKLLKYFIRMGINEIELNSPGGHLIKIIPLGLLVKELNIGLTVAENGLCASACSFLFHQTRNRSMKINSQMMYHLGVIHQGKSILEVNTCHAFDMSGCDLSPIYKAGMEEYRSFIKSLPDNIRDNVMAGEDRFVGRNEALSLQIF